MKIKKFTVLITTIFLSFTVFAQFSGGDGSEGFPYLITTPSELAQLATYVNAGDENFKGKNYKLENDLDLSNFGESYNDGAGWIPIGWWVNYSNPHYFEGVFDGNNKNITNLYIDNHLIKEIGLFGAITGTVKNLGLIDVNIFSTGSLNFEVGAILGYNSSGNVINCYSTGTITNNSVNSNSTVGGVVGYNSLNVTNCYSSCSIISTSTSSYSAYAGGVVGYNNGYSSSISNCYSTGPVTSNLSLSNSNNCFVGGVLARNEGGSVSNCYSTGKIIAANSYYTNAGGIIGYNCGYISNCYSLSTVEVSNSILSYAGGVIGLFQNHGEVLNCYSTGSIINHSSYLSCTGGIVGSVDWGLNVKNCAALNMDIMCSADNNYFGRIIGQNSAYLSNNIAFNEMLNPNGNIIWNYKGLTEIDGEDITLETINTDGTLGGRFTSENGWTTEKGKLPGLFGNAVNMPGYLCSIPVIINDNLPNGEKAVPYSQTLTAYGGNPIIWSLDSDYLPKGLELSEDGIISGIPTADGIYNFTIRAENYSGFDIKDFSIIINPLSGISDNLYDQILNVSVQNGILYITGLIPGENWYIYDLSGRLIYADIAATKEMNLCIHPQITNGLYILKSGNKTSKITIN